MDTPNGSTDKAIRAIELFALAQRFSGLAMARRQASDEAATVQPMSAAKKWHDPEDNRARFVDSDDDSKSRRWYDGEGNRHLYPDSDEDSKSLHPPPYVGRRVSSRRSARSQQSHEGSYRYASVRSLFIDFCNRTSSHGVPFFGSASFFGRCVWVCIFMCALTLFLIQTYWTMSEYLQYRTIIEMQLRFEPAPFPAATVCNLNAFKHSEVLAFPEIANTIAVWENALVQKGGLSMSDDGKVLKREQKSIRAKRQAEFQPVFVRCTCNNPSDQCVPNRNPLELNALVCLCFEEVTAGYIWPCYPTTEWTVKTCRQCSFSNTCVDPERPNATMPFTHNVSCLCQGISNNCVIHPKEEIRWWNPNNYTIYPMEKPTPPPLINENIDFEGVFDKGTMTTRTKETLIFMVAELPQESRMNLSYTLQEFVLRCTFNGKDCDMEKDFQLHVDPEYGNCYTFNFNDSVVLKNSRAGPMYGLRLLLDVHQNDYLPTTEAAGVRLVVHEQDQEPFPDTFGYSAPTGFVSSFGLKTKFLQRLDAPYGQCSDTFRPDPYIYRERYSPEGCYRNCFQLLVLKECGCGDPRLPLPYEYNRPCNVRNRTTLKCLRSITEASGGFHHLQSDCQCVQPCTENVFETAYSAAAWPSMNFNIGENCPAVHDIVNDTDACTEYYRLNTAYLEIYYEQLNFENLRETAGYTLVNLFSDFGGNIGLWIGFSVITICEIMELFFELAYYFLYIKPLRLHKKIKQKRQRRAHGLSLPQLLVKHIPKHGDNVGTDETGTPKDPLSYRRQAVDISASMDAFTSNRYAKVY